MPGTPTVVVGAGPAGLAAAAMLRSRGVDALVVERGDRLGTSWRSHYGSLRLHTVRSLSGLPGGPLPRSHGRWVSGSDFLGHLERYAARERLEIRTGTEVRRVDAGEAGFLLATGSAPIPAAAVVVATGYNREPVVPGWAIGDERVVHSSAYRDAGPYRGRAVMVVGAATPDRTSRSILPVEARAGCGSRPARPPAWCPARRSACPRRSPPSRWHGPRCGWRTRSPASSGGSSSAT